jgi:hypothetical protein
MTLPEFTLSPLLPLWALALLAAPAAPLLWRARRQGIAPWPRLLCLALLWLALLNPQMRRDQAVELRDIALVLVDDSPSMHLGQRQAQSAAAVAEVQKRLAALPNLETRTATIGAARRQGEGTLLFAGLGEGLADIPKSRLAGVIMVTDGQVHDAPDAAGIGAPLHVLLAGSRKDRDRRLVLDAAPSFAMVGTQAELAFHVEDPGHDGRVAITLRHDGGETLAAKVELNKPARLALPIEHAGANVVEIEVEAAENELTLANNRRAIEITGVRDRLRVLLLSGEPHPGERMWRNLLKADPSVDLVHFTILRSPDKDDRTPIQQLSLIAFPTRELFEERLKDFDLVIFDRFRRRNILPPAYYRNIMEHVRSGGALLLVAGPELAAADSLGDSALADILPARGDGNVATQPFIPTITAIGRRHPLFQGLAGAESDPPRWGRWVRAAGSLPAPGAEVVMSTPAGMPLLVLSHAGEGRVAQLNSDSAWLWGRNWDGGGPQAELLRRLAHWLMKEPELEENQLAGRLAEGRLRIERRGIEAGDRRVEVTKPDGTSQTLLLADRGNGLAAGEIAADQDGLWHIRDDQLTALTAVGSLDLLEMGDVRATPDRLQQAVAANGGGIAWLEDGVPSLIKQEGDARMAGSGWMALRANGQKSVAATDSRPLLPPWLWLALAVAALALAWWREGHR